MPKQPDANSEIIFVLPSLSVSGGVLEALSLADDCQKLGLSVAICTMWRSEREVSIDGKRVVRLSGFRPNRTVAIVQLPFILFQFSRLFRGARSSGHRFIFTHFSTLPFSTIIAPRHAFAFVQGLEWYFHRGKILSWTLKKLILFFYARCAVVTASKYLTDHLEAEGLRVWGSADVWADASFFVGNPPVQRGIDVSMVVGPGFCKRADLYFAALQWFNVHAPWIRIVLITNDSAIFAQAQRFECDVRFQPGGRDSIKKILLDSKVFLHLSESEGLALPPLEAIGCGCVPVCRDSGGPRSYMVGLLRQLIFPRAAPLESICEAVIELLRDEDEREALRKAGLEVFQAGLGRREQRTSRLPALFSISLSSDARS